MGICVERFNGAIEAFYDLRNQTIFQVMFELYERLEAIDVITVQQALKDKGLLEQVGGIAYLSALQDAAPSAANLKYYLDIVCEKFLLRKLIHTCTDIVGRVYDFEGDVAELMDTAERDILAIRTLGASDEIPTAKELVKKAIVKIEEMHQAQGRITGMSTNLIDLDKFTDGLHGGEMITVAGFTSGGKTSIAMNIVEHVAVELQQPVGVFSLEMKDEALMTRMLCSRARVNLRNIRDGFMAERDFPKLTGASGKLSTAPIHILQCSGVSIYQLRAKARRMFQQFGIKLFIVDYIQLLNASVGTKSAENRQNEVATISRGIKSLAMELNVPIIALSQLNDDGQLRESRAIGQDSDGVWILEIEKKDNQDHSEVVPVTLNVKKNRNGPTGPIYLTFLKTITRFESASKVSDEDIPD